MPRRPTRGRSKRGPRLIAFAAVALAALVVLVVLVVLARWWPRTRVPSHALPAAHASYVGAAACEPCHRAEFQTWRTSQHSQAMQPATERTVLGDFNDAEYRGAGVTSRFFRRDGKFMVRTDGPNGRLSDFEIRYTFGVSPLQQYLIAFPDGRMQALSVAWDARPRSAGGQCWFHLYAGQHVTSQDELHWTGLQQNWNYMCADCHSTNLRKQYDAASNTFHTSWSEINVACEACHGPASEHVAWARKPAWWRRFAGGERTFSAEFDERRGVTWSIDSSGSSVHRSAPRNTDREIEVCARCHSRRGRISEDYLPGEPIGDGYRVSLLDDSLYWHDGQMHDEVYNYGSFVQSRMYANGVTCSDCHDPHSQRLRATGNEVCERCHLASRYDAPAHHHHTAGSPGAACVACHMPTVVYMGVDPRHDHSLRIPRPDRTVAFGTPNACNACHSDRTARWAAEAVRRWTGHDPGGYQNFAESFDAFARGALGARSGLMRIAANAEQPAMVRASALERLAADPTPAPLEVAVGALADRSELVRRAAVELIANAGPQAVASDLPRMLTDSVRVVRTDAARALAALPATAIAVVNRAALARGIEEWIAVERYDADRPESHLNLGSYHADRGEWAQAEAEYSRALALSPNAVQPAVQLADAARARGDDARAEQLLRAAIQAHPQAAVLHHSLGLTLVREHRLPAALDELEQAVELDRGVARYAYVYGVALHSSGHAAGAIAVLERANQRFAGDRSILEALATVERDRGHRERAIRYAQELVALAPDDPAAVSLLRELGR